MHKRLARRLIAMPLILLAAAVLLWMALPLLVSTTLIRSAVEREITELVGRPVKIGTAPAISLLPTPTARLTNVVIPGNGDDTPLAEIDSIETELTIGSIIRGRPVFSRVHLVGVHIHLPTRKVDYVAGMLPLKNVNEAVDHMRGAPAPTADVAQADVASQPVQLPDDLRRNVGTFTFEDGTISFGPTNDPETDITELTGRFDWARLGAPANIRAEFAWRNRRFNLSAVSLHPLKALIGEMSEFKMQVDCEMFAFNFDGQVAAQDQPFADGTISFTTPSLAQALQWADTRIRPGRVIGEVSLSGPVRMQDNKLQFDNLQMNVDGNAGTGLLEMAIREADTPLLSGTLDFKSLDIRSFLGAFVALPPTLDSEMPVNLEFMDQLAMDLRISAANATFGDANMTGLAATAQTTRDVALFDIGDAEAYGGNIQARLRFDRKSEVRNGEIVLAGQGIDTAAMATEIMLPDLLPRAVGDVSMTVTSPVGSWSELTANGTGTMIMKLGSGTLAGFSPASLALVQTEAGFQELADATTTATPFDSMTLDGSIIDGVMLLRSAELVFPDDAAVTVSGLIPLASRSLALTARVQGPSKENEQRVFIGGSWNNPYATPVLSPQPPPIAD